MHEPLCAFAAIGRRPAMVLAICAGAALSMLC